MRGAASEAGYDLYIVGDQAFGQPSNPSALRLLDAVTNYDVYGSVGAKGYAGQQAVDAYFASQAGWQTLSKAAGTAFIPAATPGFNDKGVRGGHAALSRRPTAHSEPGTLFRAMFQQEVAQRIAAEPGGSAYGRLAVLAQWRSTAKLAMKVHRSAFTPPPKVMSAIVHVEPTAMPEGVTARMLERLTEAAFGQRRKMLRQSLKGVPGAVETLEKLGIDPQRRAETITVAEFVELARSLGR